jgi:hypothetical protein
VVRRVDGGPFDRREQPGKVGSRVGEQPVQGPGLGSLVAYRLAGEAVQDRLCHSPW